MKKILSAIFISLISTSCLAQENEIYYRHTPGGVIGGGLSTPSNPTPGIPAVEDTTQPVFSGGPTIWTVEAGTTDSVTITASDDSGSVAYSIQTGPAWLNYNGGVLTASPPKNSTHGALVYIRATDPSGNFATFSFPHNVSDTVDPVWYGSSSFSLIHGNSLNEVVSADDAGSDFTISRTAGDSWINFNPVTSTLSGTPPSPGSYSVTLEAIDGANNSSERVITVSVTPAPDTTPPIWGGPGNIMVSEGDSISIPLIVSDPPSYGSISISKVSGPAWISYHPVMERLVGLASSPGLSQLVLRATDSSGNSSDYTVSVEVAPSNEAPDFP